MPKVIINDSKGLVQESGSGVEISSSISVSSSLSLGGTAELSGHKRNVSTLATGTTLTAADSGKVFLLVQTGANRTATLPAVASGLTFKFIVKTASTNKWEIVQAAGTEDFVGSVVAADGDAGDSATGTDTLVRFVGNTAAAGDQIELECDGTVWYIRGSCAVTGGIVFA